MSENKNMQELNLDEMNKVSGGSEEFAKSIELMGCPIHDENSLKDFIDTVLAYEQSLGKPCTEMILEEMCPNAAVYITAYKKGGLNELRYSLRTTLNP